MTIGEALTLKTRRNLWLGLLAWLAFAGSSLSLPSGERGYCLSFYFCLSLAS